MCSAKRTYDGSDQITFSLAEIAGASVDGTSRPAFASRPIVSPWTKIENAATIQVITTITSRSGTPALPRPLGMARAMATDSPPRKAPQVRIQIVPRSNSNRRRKRTVGTPTETEAMGIEKHHLLANRWEVVFHVEIMDRMVVGKNFIQQRP